MDRRRAGFTLTEMMVVSLILGILAFLAVPSYYESMERGKAASAVNALMVVGRANEMYALDHGGKHIEGGGGGGSGGVWNDCTAACCPGVPGCVTPAVGYCLLVACKYLSAAQHSYYKGYPYFITVDDPAGNTTCGNASFPVGTGHSACAVRCGWTGSSACTQRMPYMNWAYGYRNGVVTAFNGAPAP